MRMGRWLGIIVGIVVVLFAVVMLVLMQRQLERLRDARAAAKEPAAASHGEARPPEDTAPLPPGAMR